MVTEAQMREELVGKAIPAGEYVIEPYVHWLMTDAMQAPPTTEGVAHPIFAYFVAQGGMGVTLDEMFVDCHMEGEGAVMLGTCELEVFRPLRIGQRFTVSGQYDDVVRKTGRIGTFDLVTFHLDCVDQADDQLTSRCTLTFVYLREEDAS